MKETGDGYMLSTGTKIYANCGILGIAPHAYDSVGPKTYEGYDGYMDEADSLTPGERREIADFAIAQWNKWAIDGVSPAPGDDE